MEKVLEGRSKIWCERVEANKVVRRGKISFNIKKGYPPLGGCLPIFPPKGAFLPPVLAIFPTLPPFYNLPVV